MLHSIISSPYFSNNDWNFLYTFRFDTTYIFEYSQANVYKSMTFLLNFLLILFKSTYSQTSAPSRVPIMTSKRFPFFIQGFSLLNRSEFLAWYIICMSSILIWASFLRSWVHRLIVFLIQTNRYLFCQKWQTYKPIFIWDFKKPLYNFTCIFPLVYF